MNSWKTICTNANVLFILENNFKNSFKNFVTNDQLLNFVRGKNNIVNTTFLLVLTLSMNSPTDAKSVEKPSWHELG